MNKCLVVCPTIRPDKRKKMVESLNNTATNIDIMLLTERGPITKLINKAFNDCPSYDFYHITNDDFIYHTDGWDESFISKLEKSPGICHANDMYLKGNLPVAPFISGDIVRALGWLQMPRLYHLCGDMVWKIIGERINIIHYFKDIIIEHDHPFRQDKKVEKDEVFKTTNSKEMYKKDHAAFREWLAHDCYDDCERIRTKLDL